MRGRRGGTAALGAIATAALLLLAGCTAPPGAPAATSTQAHMQGEWMLASASDADGAFWPDAAADGVDITLAIDGNVADGRTPCNGYGMELEGGPDDVRVGALQIQEAACLDTPLMEIEGRYVAALPGLDVTADEAALELTGDGMALAFTRIDRDDDTGRSAPPAYEGDWTLTSATDANGDFWPDSRVAGLTRGTEPTDIELAEGTRISLSIGPEDGSGQSTCNSYGFTRDDHGDSFAFGMFQIYLVGCATPAHGEVEQRFLEALPNSDPATLGSSADGTTTLTFRGEGTTLTFERTEPRPEPSRR